MQVITRTGVVESVSFDKILNRIEALKNIEDKDEGIYRLQNVDTSIVAQKTIEKLHNGISTVRIDTISAETSADMITQHYEYDELAGRIQISNIQKNTTRTFSEAMENLQKDTGLLSPIVLAGIRRNKDALDAMIKPIRDYKFGYFGISLLSKNYLNKYETPQYMFMRVACGLFFSAPPEGSAFSTTTGALLLGGGLGVSKDLYMGKELEDMKTKILLNDIRETYEMQSKFYFVHATPILYTSGTNFNTMVSCFLVEMKGDSVEGIYDTIKECALLQKSSGGVGIHVHNIRSAGTIIKSSGRESSGIVPMLKVFEATSSYIDQNRRRPGTVSIYIAPWHGDIMEFLELGLHSGVPEKRAPKLYFALWIPDYFMECVHENKDWYLMSPNICTGLSDAVGDDFKNLYLRYVQEGKYLKKVSAQDVWEKIRKSEIETGMPYILFSDACNKKSSQKNLGVIKSSNLCSEVVLYSSKEETACCVLGSIKVSELLVGGEIDYALLQKIVRRLVINLNKVIDINTYPTPETRRASMNHRPIGIGIQDLATLFIRLQIPYSGPASHAGAGAGAEARKINRKLTEVIYYSALDASCSLAEKYGAYSSFADSPASRGILQYDMWNDAPRETTEWGWKDLKERIMKYGLRNSTLMCFMPTKSTSHILGSCESFEPIYANIYIERSIAGNFVVVNKTLIKDLCKIGRWNSDINDTIMAQDGSIQGIKDLPADMYEIYKTVWEIKMKDYIDMCADRAPFICQSQSMNIYTDDPEKLTSIYRHAWLKGLKTGAYYTRCKINGGAIKATIDPSVEKKGKERMAEKEKTIPRNSEEYALTGTYKNWRTIEKEIETEEKICPIDGTCDSCSA